MFALGIFNYTFVTLITLKKTMKKRHLVFTMINFKMNEMFRIASKIAESGLVPSESRR